MNRIQRIATAAAVGTAVLVPATAALAKAEPYPWHESDDSRSAVVNPPKAQIEHEELLQPGPEAPPVQPAPDESGSPGRRSDFSRSGSVPSRPVAWLWLAGVANRDWPDRDHPRSGHKVARPPPATGL